MCRAPVPHLDLLFPRASIFLRCIVLSAFFASLTMFSPWSFTHCSIIVYFHLHPLGDFTLRTSLSIYSQCYLVKDQHDKSRQKNTTAFLCQTTHASSCSENFNHPLTTYSSFESITAIKSLSVGHLTNYSLHKKMF